MRAGSTAALPVMLSPERVRSTHGDIRTADDGCGSPASFNATRVAAAPREIRCEGHGRRGRSDGVRAAVEIEDDLRGVTSHDVDVHHGDPVEAAGRCRDVGGEWARRHHLLEDDPLLVYLAPQVEGRGPKHLVEGFALLPAHDRFAIRTV